MRPELSAFLAIPVEGLLSRYSGGIEKIRGMSDLSDEQADRVFSGDVGAWSCRTLLGHLLDAELAFLHRMRRVVAEELPAFAIWLEDEFVSAGLYATMPTEKAFNVLRDLRSLTTVWLNSLQPGQYDRKGIHPEKGEQTLHEILAYCAWHMEHHGWFAQQKIALMKV